MARLTVQFPDRTSQMLNELSEREQVSKTEILRRALSLYKYLDKETHGGDRKIVIADTKDQILKEIVITK